MNEAISFQISAISRRKIFCDCRVPVKRLFPALHYECRGFPCDNSFSPDRSAMRADSIASRPVCEAPMRWIHCYCYLYLVLSLPWSIAVISGWFGLLLHLQVALVGAWLLERVLCRRLFRKTA
jgi:hypothetical protein